MHLHRPRQPALQAQDAHRLVDLGIIADQSHVDRPARSREQPDPSQPGLRQAPRAQPEPVQDEHHPRLLHNDPRLLGSDVRSRARDHPPTVHNSILPRRRLPRHNRSGITQHLRDLPSMRPPPATACLRESGTRGGGGGRGGRRPGGRGGRSIQRSRRDCDRLAVVPHPRLGPGAPDRRSRLRVEAPISAAGAARAAREPAGGGV